MKLEDPIPAKGAFSNHFWRIVAVLTGGFGAPPACWPAVTRRYRRFADFACGSCRAFLDSAVPQSPARHKSAKSIIS